MTGTTAMEEQSQAKKSSITPSRTGSFIKKGAYTFLKNFKSQLLLSLVGGTDAVFFLFGLKQHNTSTLFDCGEGQFTLVREK